MSSQLDKLRESARLARLSKLEGRTVSLISKVESILGEPLTDYRIKIGRGDQIQLIWHERMVITDNLYGGSYIDVLPLVPSYYSGYVSSTFVYDKNGLYRAIQDADDVLARVEREKPWYIHLYEYFTKKKVI